MLRPASARTAPAFDYNQHVVWGVVAGAITIMLLGLLLGSTPVKIACVIVGLATLQGLWRGGAEVVGIVAGLLVASVLAAPIGRGLEGAVSSVLGTTGLTNRVASMAIVATAIVALIGGVGSWLARRWLAKSDSWKPWNRCAGAGLGLAEGCLLAMLVLWGLAALEPVARQRSASEQDEWMMREGMQAHQPASSPPRTLAARVLEIAEETRSSFLGPVVRATNPLPDTRLLTLASDFAAVSRDEHALGQLLSSEPMIALEQTPSIQSAMERIKADQQLAGLFDAKGISTDSLRAFFDSPTVLDILDNTSVVRDVAPFVEGLERAVRDAKASLDARRRTGG